ncbi:MAG: SAM-dependent methyltransferase [bacterium]
MQTLDESILAVMDCGDKDILPFLPCILQDFWSIGTDPEVVIGLIKKHIKNTSRRTVLDLGCGKGAVSVKIAKALQYNCHGIDGIADFVSFAAAKADEYGVAGLCKFEQGDIREKIENTGKYDIIVLGAIGQVLGNYFQTLTLLALHLTRTGIIIIDDGYVADNSSFVHPHVLKRSEMLKQIAQAGMMLVDEVPAAETTTEVYEQEYSWLARRCDELAVKHPEKRALFEDYKKQQQMEYENLKSEISCATLVVRKKDRF